MAARWEFQAAFFGGRVDGESPPYKNRGCVFIPVCRSGLKAVRSFCRMLGRVGWALAAHALRIPRQPGTAWA